jgi:hypothetical protein
MSGLPQAPGCFRRRVGQSIMQARKYNIVIQTIAQRKHCIVILLHRDTVAQIQHRKIDAQIKDVACSIPIDDAIVTAQTDSGGASTSPLAGSVIRRVILLVSSGNMR